MTQRSFSYESVLADSLKVNWRVDDLIGGDKHLDFTRPFLPDSLAGVRAIGCLDEREKLVLNHIRGNSYLYLFGLVEEFILPFVLDQTRASVHGDACETRALATFAEEEAKHIHLFRRFAEDFERGFGTRCDCIGPAKDIAAAVLAHSPLGVALVTLHLEFMTQRHYVDSIKAEGADTLDPQFCSLLRHHWMEEAQHARLDTLLVDRLSRGLSPAEVEAGIADYGSIGKLLDGGLMKQVELDAEALARATGRTFTGAELKEIMDAQSKSYRWTFLGSGMTHPSFLDALGELSPAARASVAEMGNALS